MQERHLVEAHSLAEADVLLDKAEALLNEHRDPSELQAQALAKVDQAWAYRRASGLLVPASRFSEELAVPLDKVGEGDYWGRIDVPR